jgi:D-alanine--poly(phosphoribitol) ligase subunit 1
VTALPCPLLARFQAVCDTDPGAPALAGPGGVVTYHELAERAIGWRDRLLALALPSRTAVAVLSNGSAALVPAFLGVRAAGAVPLLVDTLIPPSRRGKMISVSRSGAVVDTAAGSVTRLDSVDPVSLPPQAGYLAFSSGSQGTPKGIIGNAAGLAAFLDWERELLGLGSTIRGALLTSPSFDVVLRDLLLPLICGGVLCVPEAAVRTDPASVAGWLASSDVNVVHLVPSLSARWVADADAARLEGLRWSLFAGEPLYSRHVRRWKSIAPNTRVINLYGPSETTLAKYWHIVSEPVPDGLQPVGRGLPGTRLRADPIGRTFGTDPGEAGDGSFRITLETPDGSLGYLPAGASDADRRALVRQDGVTTFVTQDRGRLDPDGLLTVEGRLDSLVKRNGVLVDLAHITAVALADAGVTQAYCLQVDPDAAGRILLAVEGSATFSLSTLTRRLRRTLGPAMPNEVVHLDRMPVLPNGKIDRRSLRFVLEQR